MRTLAWLLAACATAPDERAPGPVVVEHESVGDTGTPAPVDADADGFTAGAGDCDDGDAAVHPGATEVCGDGRDDDCDGDAGACGVLRTTSVDDGVELLGDDEGARAGRSLAVGDLDGDAVGDVLVGAYLDDGGGEEAGAVYLVTGPPTSKLLTYATATFHGGADHDRAGYALAIGDWDGDGVGDAVVGAVKAEGYDAGGHDAATIVGGDLAVPLATLVSTAEGSEAGTCLAAGDTDGDGLDDVLVGAPGEARAYLVFGGATGATGLADGYPTLSETGVGTSVALADVDGDGLDDAVVGAASASVAVWVMHAPFEYVSNDLSGYAEARFTRTDESWAGWSLATGDWDGDGLPDLLVGAPNAKGESGEGAAYVAVGVGGEGEFALSASQAVLTGSVGDWAGYAVAMGDVDGDGFADAVVGAHSNDDVAHSAGVAYVVRGGASGKIALSDADGKLYGERAEDGAGMAVACGDVDGDGFADAVVGAPLADERGDQAGAAYVLFGGGL